MKKLIYVAGPYSGDIKGNIKRAEEVSIRLIREGFDVITPHKNTAGYERYEDENITYETWMELSLNILSRCDAICVLNGSKQSKGTQREIEFAKLHNIKILNEKKKTNGLSIQNKIQAWHIRLNSNLASSNVRAPLSNTEKVNANISKNQNETSRRISAK